MEIRQTTLKHLTHGCGRRGRLTLNWTKTEPAEFVEAREIGSLTHAGIAAYYLGGEVLPAIQATSYELTYDEDGRTLNDPEDGWEPYINVALNLTETYIQWVEEEALDQGLTVLAVEQQEEAHLFADWTLTFTPDLVVRDERTGFVKVIDFKTRKRFQALHHQDFQARTYCAYTSHRDGGNPATFEWRQIKQYKEKNRTKPPYFKQDEVFFGNEELYNHSTQIVDGLHAPNFIPRFNGECEWSCPFYTECYLIDSSGETTADIMEQQGYTRREV